MPTVLITGTSTGFGRVTTELLAARGWRVFATMRDLARKDSLEHALREAGLSERVTFVRLDVTDPASIETAVATVLSETDNTLDAVVHNAGIAVAGVLEDLSDGDIWRVMDTNFFGVLRLTRALLPRFREQRRGRIVLLSSQAAFAGQPGNSMYCARNGRWKDGPSRLPTKSIPSASMSFSSSLAPIAPRSGAARNGSCRRTAPIFRG
jgi:NAD(P)-dependent dehydrogenase (short-subunit alcohol dehydrogenase family)